MTGRPHRMPRHPPIWRRLLARPPRLPASPITTGRTSLDTLSDVLRALQLTGAVFFDVDVSPPWAVRSAPPSMMLPLIAPGADHMISYHAVIEGFCFGGLLDTEPLRLETGDVIVFPHGDDHVMSSAPGLEASPVESVILPPHSQLPILLADGVGGPHQARIICGYLGCGVRPFNPLLATLPRVLHMSRKQGSADGWLASLIDHALGEVNARRAGGECVLARLSELLFVEAVRRYIDTLPPEQTGWLAGLRDPFVGRALALLHELPARPWTLEELADSVGMSRSTLAERFAHLVGLPPMQYLTQWRMQVAAGLLARGTAKVASVGAQVGYESEAAFSRAFKRSVGVAPAHWRERQAARTPPA